MTQTNFGSFTQDAFSQMLLEQEQFTTTAQVGGTIAANVMTGGQETFILCTGNGANGLTTRTAAQMYADLTAQLGIAPPGRILVFPPHCAAGQQHDYSHRRHRSDHQRHPSLDNPDCYLP